MNVARATGRCLQMRAEYVRCAVSQCRASASRCGGHIPVVQGHRTFRAGLQRQSINSVKHKRDCGHCAHGVYVTWELRTLHDGFAVFGTAVRHNVQENTLRIRNPHKTVSAPFYRMCQKLCLPRRQQTVPTPEASLPSRQKDHPTITCAY